MTKRRKKNSLYPPPAQCEPHFEPELEGALFNCIGLSLPNLGLPQIQTRDTVKKTSGKLTALSVALAFLVFLPSPPGAFIAWSLQQRLHAFCSRFIAVPRGRETRNVLNPLHPTGPHCVSPEFLLTLTLSPGVLVTAPFPCGPQRRTGHRQAKIDHGKATFFTNPAHLFLPALWAKTCPGRHTR